MPFAADPLLDVAVDALDAISAGAFIGSLIGVLVLVAVPVLLLGRGVAVGDPAGGVERWRRPATVAGRLYALSTAGSLVGTLLSALVLIPLVGTRRTFLIFALAIAARGGLGPAARAPLRARARRRSSALIALPVGTLKAETDDGRVIHEARHRVPVRARDRAPTTARARWS